MTSNPADPSLRVQDGLHTGPSVRDRRDDRPALRQHLAEQESIVGTVVDDEHTAAGDVDRGHRRGGSSAPGGVQRPAGRDECFRVGAFDAPDVRREAEVAPLAGRRGEEDHIAPEQVRQAAAHREAEPCAAVASGGRCVRLRERLKDPFRLLGGHPDAAVVDVESEPGSVRLGLPMDGQTHHSFRGELECVADEVDEDLPDPHRVRADRLRERVRSLDLERKPESWRGPRRVT